MARRPARRSSVYTDRISDMKILREGDRGYALSPERGRVQVEYRYQQFKLEEANVTVDNVLLGVDVETGAVLTIPAQSSPKLKAAREAKKEKVLSVRMPRELNDVLNLIAEYYHTEPEQFSPAVIRYYLASASQNAGLTRRLGKLSKDRLACGKLEENLRLRVHRDLHDWVYHTASSTEGVNQSDLIRGAIVAVKQDVLEGRAKKRRRELEAIAQAV